MKHLYILLLGCISHAQIVNIPDAGFKNTLVNSNCARLVEFGPMVDVDANDDGEIQVSEALAVYSLALPAEVTNSIEGIQAFGNLYGLYTGSTLNSAENISILENLTWLRQLHFGTMNLAAFDFSQLVELIDFNAGFNPLVTIDLSATKVQYLNVDNCNSLEYLNCKNGYPNTCGYGPDDGCWFWQPLQSHFKHLCCDEFDFEPGSGYTPMPWGVVNNYCSFAPAGDYNVISGNITFDCGSAAIPAGFISISATEGTTQNSLFSEPDGEYLYYMGEGNVVITPNFQNPYYIVAPPSFNHTFVGFGEPLDVDFCISPNGVHPDVEVSIIPTGPARPGFDAIYKIEVYNKGTQPMSGSLVFNFNDSVLDYVSSSPAGTASTGSVNWPFNDIAPLAKSAFFVVLNVNSPMENPPVNIGDVLHFSSVASTTVTDETPQNNSRILNQTVVGSYDPNDKQVAEGNQIPLSYLDDYLHYTIRFQNTGTAAATNVVIDDVLQSSLDPSTVEVISSSHPMHVTREGNKLQFFHEGINLPAASIDEPGSHGYVSYKVKPAPSVGLGSVIQNSAKIFFDYNFPIITNTATTTVVQQLGIPGYNLERLRLYPNPAGESFAIQAGEPIKSVKIFNQLGQLLETVIEPASNRQISVGDLQSGTYIISITTQSGSTFRKLIKS